MIYLRLILFSAGFLVFFPSGGQEIVRSTLSSAGSASFNNGILIKQTIGQPPGARVFATEFGILRQGFQQVIDLPISVTSPLPDDKSGQLFFGMYPNPARDFVYIDLPGESESFEISITDMSGKRVYHQSQMTGQHQSLDIQHLSSGIYFITVRSEGKRGIRKLVIL